MITLPALSSSVLSRETYLVYIFSPHRNPSTKKGNYRVFAYLLLKLVVLALQFLVFAYLLGVLFELQLLLADDLVFPVELLLDLLHLMRNDDDFSVHNVRHDPQK